MKKRLARRREPFLCLGPGESLTISMRLWGSDVWSADDPFCHDDVVFNPEQLEAIQAGAGARLVLGQAFASYYGDCCLTYNIQVRPCSGRMCLSQKNNRPPRVFSAGLRVGVSGGGRKAPSWSGRPGERRRRASAWGGLAATAPEKVL
jgi:hypothetical protein